MKNHFLPNPSLLSLVHDIINEQPLIKADGQPHIIMFCNSSNLTIRASLATIHWSIKQFFGSRTRRALLVQPKAARPNPGKIPRKSRLFLLIVINIYVKQVVPLGTPPKKLAYKVSLNL